MSAPSWLDNLPDEQLSPNGNAFTNKSAYDCEATDGNFEYDDDADDDDLSATVKDQSQSRKSSKFPHNGEFGDIKQDHDAMQNQGTFVQQRGTWEEYKEHATGGSFWVDISNGESTYVRPSIFNPTKTTTSTSTIPKQKNTCSPSPPSRTELYQLDDNPRRPTHRLSQQQQHEPLSPQRPSGRDRLAAAMTARNAKNGGISNDPQSPRDSSRQLNSRSSSRQVNSPGSTRQASPPGLSRQLNTSRSPPPPRFGAQRKPSVGTRPRAASELTTSTSPTHSRSSAGGSAVGLDENHSVILTSPQSRKSATLRSPEPLTQNNQTNAQSPTMSEASGFGTHETISLSPAPSFHEQKSYEEEEEEERAESPKSYYSTTSSSSFRARAMESPPSTFGSIQKTEIETNNHESSPDGFNRNILPEGGKEENEEEDDDNDADEQSNTGNTEEKDSKEPNMTNRVASVTGHISDLSKGLRGRVGSGVKGLWGRMASKKKESSENEEIEPDSIPKNKSNSTEQEFEFNSEDGDEQDAYVLDERERTESIALQCTIEERSIHSNLQEQLAPVLDDKVEGTINFQDDLNVPIVHCREDGSLLFLSAAIAAHDPLWDSEGGKEDIAGPSVVDETIVVFSLIKNTVARAGLKMSDVVRVDLALTDIELLESVDEAFFEFFPQEPFPARVVTAGCQLPETARIQATCVVSNNTNVPSSDGQSNRKGVRGSIEGPPQSDMDAFRWLGSKVPVALGGVGYRSALITSNETDGIVKQRLRRKTDIVLRGLELFCSLLSLALSASSGAVGVSPAVSYMLAVAVLLILYTMCATAAAGAWWVENERPQWKPQHFKAAEFVKSLAEDARGKIVTAICVFDLLFLFLASTSFTAGAVVSSALSSDGKESVQLSIACACIFFVTVLMGQSAVLSSKWYWRKFPKTAKLTAVSHAASPKHASVNIAAARMLV